jgi:ATP-dependent Lon protease
MMIQRYTREAGVRNLEREISAICRKTARKVVNQEGRKKHVISPPLVASLLGPPPFKISQIEEKDQIGLVTGLAWTQVGGELLCVETLTMPGKGKVNGHRKTRRCDERVGPGGREFRPLASRTSGRRPKIFTRNWICTSISPKAPFPKMARRPGITMCTSLVSALTRRPVRRDVAMTGEITLRGRVLPIGGLKEKMLAAHRGGIRKVIIPKENEKDLKDIPKVVTRQMKVVTVEHMDEVLGHAWCSARENGFHQQRHAHSMEKDSADQSQISIN